MKKIILVLVPMFLGLFITGILERVINVWLARGIGILVATIIVLILSYFWINGN